MRRAQAGILLLLLIAAAGLFLYANRNLLSMSVDTSDIPLQDNEKPAVSESELELRVHELVNEERAKNGLDALGWDGALSDIARAHSADMAARGFFSHTNPDGLKPAERGDAAGYPCRKDYGTHYTAGIAENLFQNNLYTTFVTYGSGLVVHNWTSQEDIARSTVDGWMRSPNHRSNILTATYGVEGIGVVISADDEILITENFC